MRFSFSRAFFVTTTLASLTLACTVNVTNNTNGRSISPDGTVTQTVGTAGGTVDSDDGDVTVEIPAGALKADVAVTVKATAMSPAAGNIGTVYEIGPTGTQFGSPVTLTFHYGSADLMGVSPSLLRIGTIQNGKWVAIAGYSEDPVAKTVLGTTTHLSPYTLFAPDGTPLEDAGTDAESDAPIDDASADAPIDDAATDASFDAPPDVINDAGAG
jgi:hypothetical protein